MEEFEKRIQINENRILIYSITGGYAKPTYTIQEGFLENGEVVKSYTLSQWDDYGFRGWASDDEDIKRLSFEFDMTHPLYIPLIHLLNYDEELVIDDDDTREENKNFMQIHQEEDKILVDFVNELDDDYLVDRFNVFIKNILFDGRSKIDQQQKDTKTRLIDFFNEANNTLTNDYHQVSIEEWLLRNSTREEAVQMKKVFKRKIQEKSREI